MIHHSSEVLYLSISEVSVPHAQKHQAACYRTHQENDRNTTSCIYTHWSYSQVVSPVFFMSTFQ